FNQHVHDVEDSIIPEILAHNGDIDFELLTNRLEMRKNDLVDKMRARMKPRRSHCQSKVVLPAISNQFRCA
ncbi:MAG: hypothetical protein ACRD3W_02990, partial [Terriglobales bacterium]